MHEVKVTVSGGIITDDELRSISPEDGGISPITNSSR